MSDRHKKGYDKKVFRSLAMVTQFGINMLVPITLMSALGIYLDRKFDTSFWMILLFFAGAVAGGQNVFRMAGQILSSGVPEEKRRKEDFEPEEGTDGGIKED